MNNQSLMQQALKNQWQQLPRSLQVHYQLKDNVDSGVLSIDYPMFMQPILSLLRLLGVLINRRGKDVPTTVEKIMQQNTQYWKRTIQFSNSHPILFKSHWVYAGNNKLIEYVNSWLGLEMSVKVENNILYYEGEHFVLKLGRLKLPIPEWLLLGHTTIEELALDDDHFVMDFRLRHPLFGQLFRYSGTFNTSSHE